MLFAGVGMGEIWADLKRLPPWAWVAIVVGVLVAIGSVLPEESQKPTAKTGPDAVEKPSEGPAGRITNKELIEFDDEVFELDPDEKLVAAVALAPGSDLTVDVTITLGLAAAPQVTQGEVAISMRDALSKICECSPYLRFNTENGQRIVEIGRGKPKWPG